MSPRRRIAIRRRGPKRRSRAGWSRHVAGGGRRSERRGGRARQRGKTRCVSAAGDDTLLKRAPSFAPSSALTCDAPVSRLRLTAFARSRDRAGANIGDADPTVCGRSVKARSPASPEWSMTCQPGTPTDGSIRMCPQGGRLSSLVPIQTGDRDLQVTSRALLRPRRCGRFIRGGRHGNPLLGDRDAYG